MTFDKINRRTHLYLGLSLLPWFFMYGLSSFPLNHKGDPAKWTVRGDREYRLPPIEPGANLDEIGEKILQDCGLPTSGRFGAFKDPQGTLHIYQSRFVTPTRVTYFPNKNRVVIEDRDFHLPAVIVEMHVRGGFEKGGFLDTFWSVIVDIVGVATVLWVLSGIYMWWHLKQLRFWGWVAVAGGVGSFAFFMLAL